MDILESLVTIGLVESSVYSSVNGDYGLAIYSGIIATALVLTDTIIDKLNVRKNRQVACEEDRWNFEVMKLNSKIY